LFLVLATASTFAQRVRIEPFFPNFGEWVTLKCDFHMHTVFSDGSVWPPHRAEEAWREGYDAIAITDHIEYRPHKQDMVLTNHNRPFELARPSADALGLLLVQSAELTRGEPPGHWNLLFLTNINLIPTNDHRAALRAATNQGAFIFWNHPGWKQPNRRSKWYKEQKEALQNGWLHGLEVVNGNEYDPIVHEWCIEHKLTMLGNSDVHGPTGLDYSFPPGRRRPITLVFAKARTADAIKEALTQRRTAIWNENNLYGSEEHLRPLFDHSLEIKTPGLAIKPKCRAILQVHSRCAVGFQLEAKGKVPGLTFPEKLTLHPGVTMGVEIRRGSNAPSAGQLIKLPYRAQNLVPAPGQTLAVEVPFFLEPDR
jgi:hypothetical protein